MLGNIDVVCRWVDFSVMLLIRKFVDVIKEEEGNVDILINNVGVLSMYNNICFWFIEYYKWMIINDM